MTEKQRQYRKERSKRIVINLTMEDYNRWQDQAAWKGVPLATMIRQLVEVQIAFTNKSTGEDAMDQLYDQAAVELAHFREACLRCAYNDEGSCSCYEKKSICCPYADDAEEGD